MQTKPLLFSEMNTRQAVLAIIILIAAYDAFAKRIYVQPSNDSTAERRRVLRNIEANIGTIIHDIPELNGASFEVPNDLDISILQSDPRFSFVAEVPVGRALYEPNDYDFYDQWALQALQMDKVWDLVLWNRTIEKNITLAICDTGFTFTHPDLEASRVIWQYDYVNNDTDATDDNEHGTHVTGVAAATTDNSIGMAGMAYGVNLMIGKVLDAQALGHYDAFMKCIIDATNNGANIINLSLGGYAYYSPFEDAVNYAVDHGVFVVSAAGNTGQEGNGPLYPGAFANSFSVANLQQDDTTHPTSTSNSFVDIAAPGTFIEGTVPSVNQYALFTGTSQAAPIVAGVAALMMAVKPDISVQELTELLQTTATDLGEVGKDDQFGYGKINPLKAAGTLLGLSSNPIISVDTGYDLIVDQPFSLNVACSSFYDTCVSLTVADLPAFMNKTYISATQLVLSATPTSADIGGYVVTFSAKDSLDATTDLKVTFTVGKSYSTPGAQSPSATPRSVSLTSDGFRVSSYGTMLITILSVWYVICCTV